MCRFVAYHGKPVNLSSLLYEPEHSLIHQSTHAHEREEPLNGDGWGVGWYVPNVTQQPAQYRTVHPAWSDDNMRHVAPTVATPVFLAHVRAASPGLAVQQMNCHPFRGGENVHDEEGTPAAGEDAESTEGTVVKPADEVEEGRRRLLFMHNGAIGAYRRVMRRLRRELPDELYFTIRGTTDSEHAFAVVQRELGERAAHPTVDDLAEAMRNALGYLNRLKVEEGAPEALTQANMVLSDGERLVATRYSHPVDHRPNSLYVGEAGGYYVEDGEVRPRNPDGEGSVLVASERLFDDERVWDPVPPDHLVKVTPDGEVQVEPMGVHLEA